MKEENGDIFKNKFDDEGSNSKHELTINDGASLLLLARII
jgi:hypothetical protein